MARVVSGLGCSSFSTVNGRRPPTSTGTISSANADCAASVAARRCDSAANSSWRCRETSYFVRDVLRGDAHVDPVERVGQHHHGAVGELAVAEPVAVARAEVVERHPGHRLVAAGEGEVEVVPAHLHRRGPDRLQAGAAEPVDRVRRHVGRQAGGDRDPAGVVGVRPDLADAPHDHFLDLLGVDAGALQRRASGGRAELVAGHVLEDAAEAADGGPGTVEDDDPVVVHGVLSAGLRRDAGGAGRPDDLWSSGQRVRQWVWKPRPVLRPSRPASTILANSGGAAYSGSLNSS